MVAAFASGVTACRNPAARHTVATGERLPASDGGGRLAGIGAAFASGGVFDGGGLTGGARSNGGRFRRRGGVWFSVVFLERGARKRAVKHGQAEKRRTGGAESARKRKPPVFIGDCLRNRLFYRAKRETTPAPAEIMV